jgi:gephyrin
MISMNKAIKIIMTETLGMSRIETISIKDLDKLNGSILADDMRATIPLPPFPASIKDGYAVVAEDGSGPRKLMSISATAGNFVKANITSGFCTRISTGAPIPNGANAVVQVEDTKVLEQTEVKHIAN